MCFGVIALKAKIQKGVFNTYEDNLLNSQKHTADLKKESGRKGWNLTKIRSNVFGVVNMQI